MAVEIQIMIPQYGELNRIYSDFIISHTFSFDKQKFITNFYKQYNNTKAFEAAILELVLDKHKEQYTLILNSLRTEIEKNILIYEKHPLFDDEIISRVCYNFVFPLAQQQSDSLVVILSPHLVIHHIDVEVQLSCILRFEWGSL